MITGVGTAVITGGCNRSDCVGWNAVIIGVGIAVIMWVEKK